MPLSDQRGRRWRCAPRQHGVLDRACATKHSPLNLTRNLIVDTDVNAQLFPEDLSERAAIPHVYPVADATTLLEVHALLCHDPVEALRSGNRGAEPDLLVRGLLVQNEGILLRGDFKDAGLRWN